MRFLSSLILVAALAPANGFADAVTVDCSGGTADYSTITAALTALRAVSNRNHQVSVKGACAEFVQIVDFENLTIAGPSTSALEASIVGMVNQGSAPTVRVAFSKNIIIRDLLIEGGVNNGNPTEVVGVADSSLTLSHCTVQKGTNGLAARGLSHVNVGRQTTFRDNSGSGIAADDASAVSIGQGPEDTKVVIEANGVGISAISRATVTIAGVTEIRGNANYGVSAAGSVIFVGGYQVIVADNGLGLAAMGGSIHKTGTALLRIEQNQRTGFSAFHGGVITLMNAVLDGNGSTTALYPFDGAALVNVNASALLVNVTIRNSPVTALVVRDGATAQLQNVTISDNLAEGIRVETLSGVRFQGPPTNTVSGNGGTDLVCDSNTYVVGASLALIGTTRCGGIKK